MHIKYISINVCYVPKEIFEKLKKINNSSKNFVTYCQTSEYWKLPDD